MDKYTLEDVRDIFKELDNKTGLKGAELEIRNVNDGLDDTRVILGKLVIVSPNNINYKPHHFEFSNIILDKVNGYKTFRDVVIHEYCHYVATMRYEDDCQHDKRFVEICYELADNEEQAERISNDNGTEISDEVWNRWYTYLQVCEDVLSYVNFNIDFKRGIATGFIRNYSEDVTIEEVNISYYSYDEDEDMVINTDYLTVENIQPRETREFKLAFDYGDIEVTIDCGLGNIVRPFVYKFTESCRQMSQEEYDDMYGGIL